MENPRTLRFIALLSILVCLSFFIYQIENKKRIIKEDLVELSNIKYGLFNVDQWKTILASILEKKISEFELKGKNKAQIKKKISTFLYKTIDEFEERYYENNSGSIGGFFKNVGAKTFNIFGELKNNIPHFTNNIVDFLDDPKNKKALKVYLTQKLNEYAANTFSKQDYTLHDQIVANYNSPNRTSAINLLNIELDRLQNKADNLKYCLIVITLLICSALYFTPDLTQTEIILSIASSLGLLILGLTLPMLEIDARLAEIKLSLLGDQVSFNDQVLYYKSKSIIEVITLMLKQGSFDLLLVASLVFIFSVLFPLSKLLASIIVITQPEFEKKKFIAFLIYKTGKWSMADVMVVAIFMSYLGFSGILTEQLKQLDGLTSTIDILTTNKSRLQIGFFAFTSFAIISILTSTKIQTHLRQKIETTNTTTS